jgi:DNA-binding response OmpR family regulator
MEPAAHILVVDDDRHLRLLIDRFLRQNCCRVNSARAGQEMRETPAAARLRAAAGRRHRRSG